MYSLAEPGLSSGSLDLTLFSLAEPWLCLGFLKKTLNAPRPSEHPPVWGKNVETFRWNQ